MEAGAVIGAGGKVLYWHLPDGRSGAHLPDSRDLWDVLWENRGRVVGFAHSHPGSGAPWPSLTDLTTFSAVERGLGKRLIWWIASSDSLCYCAYVSKDDYESLPGGYARIITHSSKGEMYEDSAPGETYLVVQLEYPEAHPWLSELRRVSDY